MNVVFIIGILVAMASPSETAPYVVAWSTLLGGIIQVVVQLPALKRAGFSIRPSFKLHSPAVLSVAKLMLPAIFGAAVYQLTIFINTVFASLVGEGAVSALFYADRVVQFPIGIFSIALASVLLPVLSNAASTKDETGFNRNLLNSLRFTSFVIIPVSGFIAFFAQPIVELLFMRGKFGAADVTRVALAVQAYCVGLWGTSCHTMAVRAFIAKKDTVTPVIVGMITLSVTIFLSIILIGPISIPNNSGLGSGVGWIQQNSLIGVWAKQFNFGHAGIALSSSIGSIVSFLAIVAILKRRQLDLNFGPFLRTSIKTILATGLTILLTQHLGKVLHEVSDTSGGVLVAVQAAGSIVIFCLTSFILRIPENKETFLALQRLIGGRR
jgi:putative peptidoglycan lipid II flippase